MKIIECPRDAMQGIKDIIPTDVKSKYINSLLNIGFDTIDFGSFVSPKAIPQMHDTAEVLKQLDLSTTKSKLLAIIANSRGAQDACSFDEIRYLGFPFSISETFQQRNTNSSIAESLLRVEEIQNLCVQHKKELVVYISMAFGNPYGDEWNSDIVINWTKKLSDLGVKIIALSDTIGVSNRENISYLFSNIIPEFKNVEIGAHLHSTKEKAQEKIDAAYKSGCQRFDVAIHGFGGCPMAKDDLTGNLATEDLEQYFNINKIDLNLNTDLLYKAYTGSWDVFNKYH
ncbi:MAG TPA: hydroxymethylglutaryl-CoA lyase [Bacteroidia bacterium]|nr:hydroxymethylglutaryl-CoA lyase [Bacteroidia bacterium]